jgi:FtsH-binding integral membrane protein
MNESFNYIDVPIAERDVDVRAQFISRTYGHLLGAMLGFTLIEILLFKSGLAESLATIMLAGPWLLVLGGFIVVSWIASKVAHTASSLPAQYAALGGFVIAEAIIFVPMLFVAEHYFEGVIASAAATTLIGFAALTAVAWITRKDFSFLRGVLMMTGFLAIGGIIASVIFGFTLGIWFSVAMVALAAGSILYDTSNVIHHYTEDRYVAASLELFASVALMFWYVLRLFMSRD